MKENIVDFRQMYKPVITTHYKDFITLNNGTITFNENPSKRASVYYDIADNVFKNLSKISPQLYDYSMI